MVGIITIVCIKIEDQTTINELIRSFVCNDESCINLKGYEVTEIIQRLQSGIEEIIYNDNIIIDDEELWPLYHNILKGYIIKEVSSQDVLSDLIINMNNTIRKI